MSDTEQIKIEMIRRFGDAYKAFGLNKLMGHIVALLIFSSKPVSLDEICEQLGRSKGPVSQILRRLRDKKLIRKAFFAENNRKDYYEIEPEIFENAFLNNFALIKNNTKIAVNLREMANGSFSVEGDDTAKRLEEMEKFYRLMEVHYNNFQKEWEEERKKIYS
ncbi:MAG: MarR family transcriptional regulator [Ignavibacteriales bacterium]|nr:MarR family transcriptional regulator [Ignavibacteriales bacterium]